MKTPCLCVILLYIISGLIEGGAAGRLPLPWDVNITDLNGQTFCKGTLESVLDTTWWIATTELCTLNKTPNNLKVNLSNGVSVSVDVIYYMLNPGTKLAAFEYDVSLLQINATSEERVSVLPFVPIGATQGKEYCYIVREDGLIQKLGPKMAACPGMDPPQVGDTKICLQLPGETPRTCQDWSEGFDLISGAGLFCTGPTQGVSLEGIFTASYNNNNACTFVFSDINQYLR